MKIQLIPTLLLDFLVAQNLSDTASLNFGSPHNSNKRTYTLRSQYVLKLIIFYLTQVAKLLKPKLKSLFYDSPPKKTMPSCGISVKGEYNPEICFHGYEVNYGCKVSAYQTLPFFMDNFGPRYTEYTTTSHEQLPGHHLEVSEEDWFTCAHETHVQTQPQPQTSVNLRSATNHIFRESSFLTAQA